MHFSDLLPVQRAETVKPLLYGILLGFSLSMTAVSLLRHLDQRRRRIEQNLRQDARPDIVLRRDGIVNGVVGLIGNTPLVRINSLSNALGIEILGKAEFMNPGGSVKDRVALHMIQEAEHMGLLFPHTGSRIFEGTVGSTGISIATLAKAKGYDATIILPDDVAQEKIHALKALGADIERVRPASIVDQKQYVNVARERALQFSHQSSEEDLCDYVFSTSDSPTPIVLTTQQPRGFFADQFENPCNAGAHFSGTGPEIWQQTNGRIDAFVSGAGTGGTIAGTGLFLKKMNDEIAIVLADPQGSGLYNKVKHNVMFDGREKEGTRRRHQVDTVVEGIGINRMTNNINSALPIIDDAFKTTDAEAVAMSRYLVHNDGLFLGSSSACNLVAAVKFAKKRGWPTKAKGGGNRTIVTVLCDSGTRHYSKFWNDEYLEKAGIPIDIGIVENLLSSSLNPL